MLALLIKATHGHFSLHFIVSIIFETCRHRLGYRPYVNLRVKGDMLGSHVASAD